MSAVRSNQTGESNVAENYIEDVIIIAIKRPTDTVAALKAQLAIHEQIAELQSLPAFAGAVVTHKPVTRQPSKTGPKGPRKAKLQAAA
jgi:hypothetical protein